jgi:ribosome biogenesis protein YTM1
MARKLRPVRMNARRACDQRRVLNMASDDASRPVVFTTETQYPLPSQKIMVPSLWKRYQLSQLINKTLSLLQPVPFDFLVRGEILRSSLEEWCTEKGIGEVRSIVQ